MTTAESSSLAHSLAEHADEVICQAILLLITQRPQLQESLLQNLQSPPGQRYTGKIKKFFSEKHHGFIQCDETWDQFNSDVFVADVEMAGFSVGSVVTFSVMLNKDGKPQAKLLEGAAPVPKIVSPPGAMPIPPPRPPPAPVMHMGGGVSPEDSAGRRYSGTVHKFFPEKHYGFIQCDELYSEFGCDVFLSDMEIGDFGLGSAVTFSISLNRDGKPQAKMLEAAHEHLAPIEDYYLGAQQPAKRAAVSSTWAATPPPQKVARRETSSPNGWSGIADSGVISNEERYSGVIKHFWPEKHYGFIACEELAAQFGGDVFLSDQEIADNHEGSFVSFSVVFNKSGRPQARDLSPAVAPDGLT